MCKVYQFIGKHIEALCKEKKLTPYRLSIISGVPLTTLQHLIKGTSKNPGIMTIAKICNGLEISLGEFFSAPELVDIMQEIDEE